MFFDKIYFQWCDHFGICESIDRSIDTSSIQWIVATGLLATLQNSRTEIPPQKNVLQSVFLPESKIS